MPKFEVDIQEVYTITVQVDADTPEDAREKTNNMLEEGGEFYNSHPAEYSHTMDTYDWTVRQVGGDYTFEVTVPGDPVRTYTVQAPDYNTAREKAAEELERGHMGGDPGYTAPTADIQDWPARIINDID